MLPTLIWLAEAWKSAGGYLATGVTLLTLLIRYREHGALQRKSPPPKRADYDLAIEALSSDPLLKSVFEDLKKIELIKRNTEVYVVPEEIGAFMRFLKAGKTSPAELKRAWAYRRFIRDRKGRIVRLVFRLSSFDRFFLLLGNVYTLVVGLMFFGSLILNLYFRFAMPLPLLSIMLLITFIFSVMFMTDSLSAAAVIERRFRSTKRKKPNQTPEPTTMAVTPPAAQEPRQP